MRFFLAGVGILACVFTASCKTTMLKGCGESPPTMSLLASALTDPFRGVDDEQFTRANSAKVLVEHRVRPASTLLGRRQLTLEDCRALALTNNLELQAARIDELTKRAVQYSNKTKVLPHFLFSGELSQRDNPPYAFSDVLGQEGVNPNPAAAGGTGVTNYSTSHERSTWRYVLETRWSPTDAALAYYVTRSSSNDSMKAHYQKVRVGQKLIATVDAAFFRLLGLQQCQADAQQLLSTRQAVEAKMKKAYEAKLVPVAEYNRTHRQVVRARNLIVTIKTEVEKQRNTLASAMGLSPDYCVDGGFELVGHCMVPCFDSDFCDMEMRALQNRPEAFEAGLSHLSSVNDYKRTIIKYFPKATGFWRMTRDKDRFQYNKDWKDVGMFIYFDLLDWIANLGESRAAGHNSEKTYREMGAVALGIASQVRVAGVSYLGSMELLRNAQSAEKASTDVFQIAGQRAARDDLDKLALEEARADMMQDKVERSRAVAESNAALAELQGAMGTNYNEPRPPK